jgi:probable phosphoglycerate mutase
MIGRTLVLLRHAETAWNAERRYQGQTDIPLSEVGREQAVALRERLLRHAHLFDPLQTAVIASDLCRAHETARLVFRGHDIRADAGLREIRFGVFEGLRRAEIEERFPAELARWESDEPDFVLSGGEHKDQVRQRAVGSLERWLAELPHPTLAVVTHGGVMRQLMHHVRLQQRGGPFDVASQLSYANAAVHVLHVEQGVWSYAGSL